MKQILRLFSVLFIGLVVFSSCSKDDDPVDNNIFVGKYSGKVSYTHGIDEIKRNDNGTVTVVKVSGDTYNFNFSDDIPSLNGIKMNKGESSTLIFQDGSIGSIAISANKLDLTYAKNGQTWVANATR